MISTSIGCVKDRHRCNIETCAPLILRSNWESQRHRQTSIDYIHHVIKRNEHRCQQQDYRTIIEQEWQILSRIVDRLFACLFLIGTMLVFLVIFGQAPHLRLK
jgi:glutamine amidotransferase PdxT